MLYDPETTERNLRAACDMYRADSARNRRAFLFASLIAAVATLCALTGWISYYLK